VKRLGTSSIVVAAFIGPGTVLTCATAGVKFGFSLGWVLVFGTLAVFVLQAYSAGLGIIAQQGLGDALRARFRGSPAWILVSTLVITGLWIGCAAFEVGNLLGATAGMTTLFPSVDPRVFTAIIAAGAVGILLMNARAATRVLAGLVGVMGSVFLGAAVVAPVDWGAAFTGLALPSVPVDSLLTIVALVGTTVVPYNLFLHASATRRYWADATDTRAAWKLELRGMALFIPIGGLISYAILLTGAALPAGSTITKAADVASLLEPVAGPAARWLFGLGLFAAGFTSAVTAPMAAAAAVRELFGWDETKATRIKLVWASVIATGVVFSMLGLSPLAAIIAAQAANGVLLPVIATLLLIAALKVPGTPLPAWFRAMGVGVVAVAAVLGLYTLRWVWLQVG
jgi:NRAMP (natural resistance-associated macrophage protein)-like metal ion transporter